MLARSLMTSGRPFNSVPEFGNRDRCNLKLIIGARSHPLFKFESTLLTPNDDVGIQHYRHLSSGALRFWRPDRRSRRHAVASLFGKLVLSRASAKSPLTQPLQVSVTRREAGLLVVSS